MRKRAKVIPNPSSLFLFVSAALVLLIIPGPAVFYIVGRSIGHGRSAGLVSALGIATGSLVHTAAAAVGLSALLMSSAVAFSAVKYLGAAYLIYLGIQKLRREEPFEVSDTAPQVPLRRIFAQGVVVNVLNPKAALFYFAFLPQFVDASSGNVAAQILFLGVLFALLGATTDTFWALTSGTVARLFRRSPLAMRTQRYISGGMLISLGVATAFAGSSAKK
jgi:threonine/homoserine/homoserine lactone efflux protein